MLWISHVLPYPSQGGVLQRSHNLLRQAASRHEVHLVALVQRAQHPTDVHIQIAVEQLSQICATVKSFRIVSDSPRWRWMALAAVSSLRSSPYDTNWLYSAHLAKYLSDLTGSEKFDLIHIDTLGLSQYIAPFEYVPIILNHHNIESQMMLRRAQNETARWRRLYLRREAYKLAVLERAIAPKVAMNLVVSDLDAARLSAVVGSASIQVVDNGVDVDYFVPGSSDGIIKGGLVFAGGMNWYPNREAMLYFLREIWPALISDRADRRVTILGQNPPHELLAAASDPRIVVPGFVPDVRPYINAASIYICPIRDGGGTRLKILDALAMAKPLVATELAVEGLGLKEGTHYLRAETPTEYVRQIRRLENDNSLAVMLANAGRELVEQRYSWNVIGERLDEAYLTAVGQTVPLW